MPPEVSLVAISDLSYQELGLPTHLAFPRQCFARALERIHATKPALVIIDGYFQKEPYDCPRNLNTKAKDLCLPKTQNRSEKVALIDAIKSGPTALASHRIKPIVLIPDTHPLKNQINLESEQALKDAAIFNIPMKFEKIGDTIAMLSPTGKLPFQKALTFAGMTLPKILPNRRSLINFYGKPATIQPIHIHQILKAKEDYEYDFTDKIVFVGTMSEFESRAFGSKERFVTTGAEAGKPYFGVEIHATIAANLIDRSWIKPLSLMSALTLICTLSAFIFWIQLKLIPWKGIFVFLLGWLIWLGISYLGFKYFDVLIPGPMVFMRLGSLVYLLHLAIASGAIWKSLENFRETLGMKSV